MKETIVPAGMDTSTRFRPMVSAKSKSQPPRRSASGRKSWYRGPTSDFAICGAISPIKAIPPVTETAEAASATAAMRSERRSFSLLDN